MKDPFVRQLSISLVVLAGTIALGFLALNFILNDATAQADAIVKYRAAATVSTNNLTSLAGLKQDAGTADKYRAAIGRLLPLEDGLIEFPRQITTLASSYNISAQANLAGEPVLPANDAPGYFPFSLTASGSSDNLLGFLNSLETQSTQFLVSVGSVDLRANDSGWQLSAAGRVFFQ
jgi:hypothetical protein